MGRAVDRPAALGIGSFPAVNGANPYQRLLYEELAGQGLILAPDARLKLHWLARNRRRVAVLHFHWPQTYYVWEREPAVLRPLLSWPKLALFGTRLAVARRLGYRIVWTVHQVLPHERARARLDRLGTRALARACDLLLAHDDATAREVERTLGGSAARLEVVPHGSYVGVYPRGRPRSEVRAELAVPVDSFVFLCFGQIRAYKEVAGLLAAFAEVDDPDVRLVVAGVPVDGAAAATVLAAAGSDPRVVPLLEFVSDDRVTELFDAADAVVVPRVDGGTSGSLLLALSLGKPAVVARTDTYRELIGEGRAGWTFDPADPGSFRDALAEAAGAPEAAARRGDAALRIAEGFSRADVGARTAGLLREILNRPPGKVDVLLVCSAGGHLLQLLALRQAWEGFDRCWVTLDGSDSRSLLHDERVVRAYGPTHRNLRNLFRNLGLAWRVTAVAQPEVIVTTGAALAVPFAWIGRLRGARVVYVESITRIDRPSLSCRLVAPVAARVYAQWPELARRVQARYVGAVISSR
jgi:glycosyltransferase involved in cell wall biosynthesis